MTYQNINQYNYPKYRINLVYDGNDMSLASDEVNFNEEVVFSPYLIAQTYGKKLPINIDINNPLSVQNLNLNYKNYNFNNVFVSQNYYIDNDIECLSSSTVCDIGLTGIDNGLVNVMTGQTLNFTTGFFDDSVKFNRMYYDRRFKMFQVTGNTQTYNRFSGNTKQTLYEVVSKSGSTIGQYHELYGGFYQGFYKLFGYDYEILPERVTKGWTVEMVLKPRLTNEFTPEPNETTLNEIYPNNKNIFFYLGSRAENKFHHHAQGELSGYTRVTTPLDKCVQTCGCCNDTNSRCTYLYPPKTDKYDQHLNYGCNSCTNTSTYDCDSGNTQTCGWECQNHGCTTSIERTCETDPLFDSMSNNLAFKLCGDPKNPSIGVKVLRFTGDCQTTGVCTTEQTQLTGYTIEEYCSQPIYGKCANENPLWLEDEHWFLISAVWLRYTDYDFCDLKNYGGLNDITKVELLESLANNTTSLIGPDGDHQTIEIVNLNQKWLDERKDRLGRLKIYVNGKPIYTLENFEEIIPRGLNADKEKQLGVPFNISWGGGTQGLRENLTFSSCDNLEGDYIQDPELFPTTTLSGTSLSSLTTNILLEKEFGGTFEGGISQFRMYVEPLGGDEIKHNFNLLKVPFNMFDPDCPDCSSDFCEVPDFSYTTGATLPLDLTIDVTIYSGSVIIDVVISNSTPVLYDTLIDFDINLVFIDKIVVKNVNTVLLSGQTSTTLQIIVDEDYTKLTDATNITNPMVNVDGLTDVTITINEQRNIIYVEPVISVTTTTTTNNLQKVYYGKYSRQNLIIDELSQFNSIDTNNIINNYLMYSNTAGYCYLLIPNNQQQPTIFRNSSDGCNGFIIPFTKLDDVIIDSGGQSIIYNVYRSFVSTNANVDVWVCE